MLKKLFLGLIIFLSLLSSCVSKKKINYFQNDLNDSVRNVKGYSLRFKPDDLLVINVFSEDLEAVKPFNLPTVAYSTIANTVNGSPKQQNYLIDAKGMIQFPILGKIKIEGLTRVETIEMLTNKLKDYVTDVTVNIQILNFKVNVMGNVKTPGMFRVENERLTVLDALALAGDLSITGKRIIEVKRETKNGIVTGYLDLRSNKIFNSPFFYLQQNDVVYVNPNRARIQSSSYNPSTGLYISLGSVLITLISVLTR